MNENKKPKSSQGRLAILCFTILALAGLGLRQESSLIKRGQKAAQKSEIIQGAPIDSAPQKSKLSQREMPEDRNLEQMSASAPPPKVKDGYLSLTFDQLSQFEYPVTPEGAITELPDGSKPSIPNDIKKLDQKRVSLSGFILPLDANESKTETFILIKNQLLCCFGQEPKINEYCIVNMTEPTELILDRPVMISGSLQVGELMDGELILCLYQLHGDELELIEQ